MSEACEFPLSNATSAEIGDLLDEARTIAVVGLSDRPDRDSYHVADYLKRHGYRIIPINPNVQAVLGETSFARLADVHESVDIVDIFRRPEAVPEIVEEAIALGAKAIWMQEGVVHNEAADRARAAGLRVVMNKCLLKEHARRQAGS